MSGSIIILIQQVIITQWLDSFLKGGLGSKELKKLESLRKFTFSGRSGRSHRSQTSSRQVKYMVKLTKTIFLQTKLIYTTL